MHKSIRCFSALFLLLLLSSTAFASTSWVWTDVYPEPFTSPILLNETNPYLCYTHDITDNGFDVNEDSVTSYDLWIGLSNGPESNRSAWAWINLPGLVTDGIEKIGYEDIQRGWSVAGLISLNVTGMLDVTIKRLAGDFYFGESTLNAHGCEANPVPLPASAILLGTGLVGLIGFRRRMT